MRLIILLYLSLICVSAVAQEHADSASTADTISIEKTGLGTVFYYHGEARNPKELMYIMEDNPEAFDLMKRAKGHYNLANIFGFIGGAFIGYPLGTALGGGDPNWMLAGIGGGIVMLALLPASKYNKLTREAVKIYNSRRPPLARSACLTISAGLSSGGIGLSVRF